MTQRINMDPACWGRHAWLFFHSIAVAFPDAPTADEEKSAFDFFMALRDLIPCESCREHYREHVQRRGSTQLKPSIFKSRVTFYYWLSNLHNVVNGMLGKQTVELSIDEQIAELENVSRK